MHAFEITKFFNAIADVDKRRWDESAVNELASLVVPDDILGPRRLLLRADATLAHARWFLEGLTDYARFEKEETLGFAHLAADFRSSLAAANPDLPADEFDEIVRVLSNVAWTDITGRRAKLRARMSLQMKRDLWFASEPDPRCYLCGFLFTPEARDRFLGRSSVALKTPKLVDFIRPRLKSRDVAIEIDHVHPVAEGGSNELDNLRLACGWCNKVKGRFGSIYDAHTWPVRIAKHPTLGWITAPQPLWLLRVVSIRGRCEHVAGCLATIENVELYAAPRNIQGSLNPTNVGVYCSLHDPWVHQRFIGASLVT